jgi:hypothetical protein
MKNSRFISLLSRFLMCLLMNGLFTGCTTLESRLSIEPYTKNKPMRDELETVAEAYCRKKRAGPDSVRSEMQPDFIFTTDGCSRWLDDSWAACCIAHDITYWCGGSAQDRREADQELRRCVQNKTQVMGSLIYAGTRIGGVPWLPTPWRWGYGWDDWPRSYEKSQPLRSVKKLMEELKIHDIIEHHLSNSRK